MVTIGAFMSKTQGSAMKPLNSSFTVAPFSAGSAAASATRRSMSAFVCAAV
jgi:hypothetical protein